jgi:hypothetical protein
LHLGAEFHAAQEFIEKHAARAMVGQRRAAHRIYQFRHFLVHRDPKSTCRRCIPISPVFMALLLTTNTRRCGGYSLCCGSHGSQRRHIMKVQRRTQPEKRSWVSQIPQPCYSEKLFVTSATNLSWSERKNKGNGHVTRAQQLYLTGH